MRSACRPQPWEHRHVSFGTRSRLHLRHVSALQLDADHGREPAGGKDKDWQAANSSVSPWSPVVCRCGTSDCRGPCTRIASQRRHMAPFGNMQAASMEHDAALCYRHTYTEQWQSRAPALLLQGQQSSCCRFRLQGTCSQQPHRCWVQGRLHGTAGRRYQYASWVQRSHSTIRTAEQVCDTRSWCGCMRSISMKFTQRQQQ